MLVTRLFWTTPEAETSAEAPPQQQAAPSGPGIADPAMDLGKRMDGMWRPARTGAAGDTGSGHDPLKHIAGLPYARGSTAASDSETITIYDRALAQDGLNFVVSGHAPCAQIVDMEGVVLHEWRIDYEQVWPGPMTVLEHPVYKHFWHRAEMLPNGDLLAVFQGIGLIKIDKDSNLIWAVQGRNHHDFWVAEDGTIYSIAKELRTEIPERYLTHPTFLTGPFYDELIVTLSPDGKELGSISLFECFCNSDYSSALSLALRLGDIMHPNTLEVMDGRYADLHPLFRKGNMMVCLRHLNMVAVIDPDAKKVIWGLRGMWTYPHDPKVVEGGNILILDNLGGTMYSRLLEFNPLTQAIEWRYEGSPEQPFQTEVAGRTHRLKNGNTIGVETTKGRAFEVTPDGTIVWEYVSPHRAGDNKELVASLFDCSRMDVASLTEAFPEIAAAYGGGKGNK